jgi:DNA polymerase III sliding clamp (beta) subunit (PCNA family)
MSTTIESTNYYLATSAELVVPLSLAKAIASFSVFTDTKSVVPSLQQVKVWIGSSELEVIATDRYVAAKGVYSFETGVGAQGAIYLDPATCKFISGIKAKIGTVKFEVIEGNLTVSDYTATHTSRMFADKYPEVETIIDNWQAGSITQATLKIDLLTKLGKVVNPSGNKAEVWQFTAGDDSANPNRPVPVMASQAGVKVLIQPNLVKP